MAGFFTKPDIDDTTFKQLTGSSITLSGITNFIGTLQSKGVEINAGFVGALSTVTGHVLTMSTGGTVILSPSTGDGDFDSDRNTTRIGVPVVNVSGGTTTEFLEGYFYPAVDPGASLTGAPSRQFGDNSGFNLDYIATKNTNPISSILIDGQSVTVTGGGETQVSSVTAIFTADVNKAFNMVVTDSVGLQGTAVSNLTYKHKRFFFGNTINLITDFPVDVNLSTQVKLQEGCCSEFATSQVKAVFNITFSDQYFYYVYPLSFGSSIFIINGLTNNDFTIRNFVFTNSVFFLETFRMMRSNNKLDGTFQIEVRSS